MRQRGIETICELLLVALTFAAATDPSTTMSTLCRNEEHEDECCPGYSGPVHDCQPVCSSGCGKNSFCASPELCECLPHYKQDENGDCVLQQDKFVCLQYVEVEHMDRSSLDLYPKQLIDDFKILNIPLDTLYKKKFEMELREVCCDGYERVNAAAPCTPKVDPNLCLKRIRVEVEDSTDNSGWSKLEEAFESLNLTLPTPYPQLPRYREKIDHVCCEGYERQSEESPCLPKCSRHCGEHGFCSQPNVCSCRKGYIMALDGSCQAICDRRCEKNSVCVGNNICECEEGFQMIDGVCMDFEEMLSICVEEVDVEVQSEDILRAAVPKKQYKRVCCPGYRKGPDDKDCQPICDKPCGANSECIEPNVCKCQTNYVMGADRECVTTISDFQPDDPHVCQNDEPLLMFRSSFNMPNKQSCCPGYEQTVKGGLCHPIAASTTSQPEDNICKPHTNCECETGYTLGKSGFCEPICSQACPAHSICLKPDYCECKEGYFNTTLSCEPICLDILPDNSHCSRPNEWECNLGYIKLPGYEDDEFVCEPHCQLNCIEFSSCVAPNKCECQAGFKLTGIIINDDIVSKCTKESELDEGLSTSTEFNFDDILQENGVELRSGLAN